LDETDVKGRPLLAIIKSIDVLEALALNCDELDKYKLYCDCL